MKSKIEFKISGVDKIIVKDISEYFEKEDNNPTSDLYSRSNSGSIIVLGYHYPDDEIKYIDPIFINKHSEKSEYEIDVFKDGWITLYHIILPTRDYIYLIKPNDKGLITGPEYCFYLHEGKIYDRNHGDKEVKIEELLNINPSCANIYTSEQDYISICNLQRCLVNLCLEIFKTLGITGECFSTKSKDSDLTYKRDLVWMAINVIKYMSKYNMKAEAARIINQLEGCNGICTGTKEKSKPNLCGCGCN